MDGLENWNEKELERRGVKDLASEMAAAEKLIDLKKKDSAKYKANKNAQGKGGERRKRDIVVTRMAQVSLPPISTIRKKERKVGTKAT